MVIGCFGSKTLALASNNLPPKPHNVNSLNCCFLQVKYSCQISQKQYKEKEHTGEEEQNWDLHLLPLCLRPLRQISRRSVIFFFFRIFFLPSSVSSSWEGSKEGKKKTFGVSNTTYSNSQSDIAAALADLFDLAAPSKNKRQ